jgi:hypothetical protein
MEGSVLGGARKNVQGIPYDTVEANDGSTIPESSGEGLPGTFCRPAVATGWIPIMRASIPCMVIGEGWMAWAPILPSLGAKVSVVIGPAKKAFHDLENGNLTWLDVASEAANCFLSSMPRDMLVFVSGSTMFVKGLATVLAGASRIVVALNTGNRVPPSLQQAFPGVHWSRLVHAEVGGVTSARNWFGSGVGVQLGSVLSSRD